MSDDIKHECGLAFIRLRKPFSHYQKEYGTVLYGLNKLYLLMEKQHNRGQDGAGIAAVKLDTEPGYPFMQRLRSSANQPIAELFLQVGNEIAEVENNLSENCSLTNVKLIKGRVEETLLVRKNLPKKISILRLDTDFYSSTKVELNILYPRLVTGGVLIIDDYGFWKGARKAVDEYFKNFRPFFHYVDHSCRLMIKS